MTIDMERAEMTLDTTAERGSAVDAAVVFMVVSNEQLQAARAVATHLTARATVVNPYTCIAMPLDELTGVERPVGFIPSPRAIRDARATVRRALAMAGGPTPVLVAGQDEGTMERVAITAARRAGARIAIMPDGVRATIPVVRYKAKSLSWKAIRVADRALVAAGILVGKRGDFGSSAPDAILGWGPGWEQPLQGRAPAALITKCGNPRADGFTEMPPRPHAGRLLLCSQPLALPATAAPPREVAAWYAWLEAMDGLGDPRVRVRLHPGERSPRYDLPAGLHHLRDETPNTLMEDLAWADVVVSPYSSVLVEAVGASRVPISAGATQIWGVYAANAFLDDPRVPSVDFRGQVGVDELLAVAAETEPQVDALRDDYLANIGDAARQTAEAIAALGTAPAPQAVRRARRR
jgi:hypothetical protein